MDFMLEHALEMTDYLGVILLVDERLTDLEYTDDVVFLSGDVTKLRACLTDSLRFSSIFWDAFYIIEAYKTCPKLG